MRSIWHSLLWREWQEHKWKLASLMAISISIAAVAGWSERTAIDTIRAMVGTLPIAAAGGAVFIAMGAAAAERSSGTLDFVRALPIAPRQVMVVKLLVGTLTAMTPVVLTSLVALAIAGWAKPHGLHPTVAAANGYGELLPLGILKGGSMILGLVVSVFLWSVAVGIRQPTEMRSGLAAVLFLTLCLVAFFVLNEARVNQRAGVIGSLLALTPLGLFLLLPPTQIWIWSLVLQVLGLSGATTWILANYGKPIGAESQSSSAVAWSGLTWKRSPDLRLSSPWKALVWKQWHESLPLAVGTAATALAIVVLLPTFLWSPRHDTLSGSVALHTITPIMQSATVFGVPIALMIGLGTFVPDLQSNVWTFWRSRPISLEQWFVTKWLTSAAIYLCCMHLPIVVTAAVLGVPIDGYLAVIPLLHLMAFAVAVCFGCLVSNEIYAGILALGIVVGLQCGLVYDDRLAWLASPIAAVLTNTARPWQTHYLGYAAVMAALTVVPTLIAWLAVRWGWRLRS